MSRFTIQDETVHAAFDWLEENAGLAAVARAMRERYEDERKAAKARAFLKEAGSVAEREAKAIISDEYREACQAYYEAIEADEEFRNRRSKAEAVIQAWQTSCANTRAMGKVG